MIAKMAGLICYSAENNLWEIRNKAKIKTDEYLSKIIQDGHLSIIEHNMYVFYVTGISRTTSHQLVRKRIASFSQQSQRYVNADNFVYITPEAIKKSKYGGEYEDLIKQSHLLYQKMIKVGIKREDARYILPNATSTQLIVSMNAHALIDFLAVRICERSQWEIRELAERMLEEVRKVSPIIFRKAGAFCDFYGYCPENDKSCGKASTIEELKGNKKR
ncbi:MAG: FAD-dependent thymidylate synthase [Asgard group archaeon]|nr:FAD-dependent thymidylate synthase [Asgard group archaeon]